jgi:mycothiol synthase
MDGAEIITEREGVLVRELTGDASIAEVLALLRAGERAVGAPLVDEAEQQRLERLAGDPSARADHWHSLLATRAEIVVGYGGLVAPHQPDGVAIGDAAPSPRHPPTSATLAALLSGLERLARRTDAGQLQVWVRHAGQEEADVAAQLGFGVERRLGVLGRALDGPLPAAPDAAARVRAFRPGQDDAAVVDVLASAYADTPEAGWDLRQLRERQELPWFRPEDLLLAELPGDGDEPGRIGGIHWLKRREPAVGEVYNLAIHPRAQGSGVGALLLRAGLEHLEAIGCREVVLWVDLGNERAVRLYASQGFETRWQDLALVKALDAEAAGPS